MATGGKKKNIKSSSTPRKSKKGASDKVVKNKPAPKKVKKPVNTGYRTFVKELASYSREQGIKYKGRGGFAKRASEIWSEVRDKPGVIDNLDVILPNYLLYNQEVIDKYTQFFETREFYYWDLKPLQVGFSNLEWKGANDRLFALEFDGGLIELTSEMQVSSYYKERSQLVKDGTEDKYDVLKLNSIDNPVTFNDNNGYDIILSWSTQKGYKTTFGVDKDWKIPSNQGVRKGEAIREQSTRDKLERLHPGKGEILDRQIAEEDARLGKTTIPAISPEVEIKKLELESKEKITDKLIASLEKQFESGKLSVDQYMEGLLKIKGE